MKKFAFILIFLSASGAVAWLVWFRPVKEAGEEKKPEAEVPVHTGAITRANLRRTVTAYGMVEPEPMAGARVAPPVAGVVAVVKCAEGQKVAKGDVLFQLDSRAADVTADFAVKTLDRQKRLMTIDGTSAKTLQDAEQALATAKTQQALLTIQAPIAGVVTRINAKAGEAADLTTVLAELVDTDRLVASANVPGADLADVKPGMAAEVSLADATNAVSTTLVYASAHVDPKTGAGLVRAGLGADAGFRPGQFIKVIITTGEHKDALVVPADAVAKDTTGAWFIAVVDGGKAMLKPVKIGFRDGDWVEIDGESLDAGQAIVTEGAYGIILTQQFATKIRVVAD
jgi:RND family efflux transporter MFP subunit